jgi:hypothetical protein
MIIVEQDPAWPVLLILRVPDHRLGEGELIPDIDTIAPARAGPRVQDFPATDSCLRLTVLSASE